MEQAKIRLKAQAALKEKQQTDEMLRRSHQSEEAASRVDLMRRMLAIREAVVSG